MARPILFLLCLVVSSICYGQIPATGLVAYYPFCGNANDWSGNGHHLVNNAVSTTNRFSYPTSAYAYNGSTSLSYNDTVFNLPGNFTYSCWIVPDTAQNATFLYNGHAGSSGYGLIISGPPVYSVGSNVTVLYGGVNHMITSPVVLHQWHHVVFRKNGTSAELFIDTVSVGTSNTSFLPPVGKFHIGRNYGDTLHSFLGKVDDVAVYNVALTKAQIVQLFLDHCIASATVSPTSPTTTAGSSVSLSVSTSANVASYQWQQNTGSGFVNLTNTPPYSGVNTSILTINPAPASLNNSQYRCVLVDISCCPDTTTASTLTVTAVNTCPTVSNLPDTIQACKNTTIQLSPTLSGGGSLTMIDTTWTPSTGLSNPNIINPVLTVGTTSGLYKLTVLGVSSTNLVVNGNFNGGNSGFTSSYSVGTGGSWGPCSSPATYGITTNPTNLHSLWASFGDHTTGSGQMMCVNGSSTANTSVWCQTVNVLPNTLYDFSTWLATCEATSPAILQFSINGNLLGVPFTAPPVTGQWIQFHNTWFSGSSTTATICVTNQNTAFAGNDFALDDIQFREACSASDSVFIKAIDTFHVSKTATLCSGGSLIFGGQTISTAGTYTHTFTSTTGCDSVVSLVVTIATPVNTTQTASLCQGASMNFGGQVITTAGVYNHTFTGAGGCDSIVTLTVTVLAPINSAIATSICEDSSFVFAGQLIDTAGVYSHTFTSSAGCDSIVSLTVSISLPPTVDFSFTPITPVLNEPTQFSNASFNATTYLWDFGDGAFSPDKNPLHLYTKSGTYLACLTGWSAEGCKDKICKEVKAEVFANIDIPSAFSPNGDGENDILYVRGVGIKEFTLRIFNRWGQLIYETSDLKAGWDGRYKGRLQNTESVAYTLTATLITGEAVQKVGNITIMQ
jgi:gliding motility-associated-like protein